MKINLAIENKTTNYIKKAHFTAFYNTEILPLHPNFKSLSK